MNVFEIEAATCICSTAVCDFYQYVTLEIHLHFYLKVVTSLDMYVEIEIVVATLIKII